jgi:hypothetical protein
MAHLHIPIGNCELKRLNQIVKDMGFKTQRDFIDWALLQARKELSKNEKDKYLHLL